VTRAKLHFAVATLACAFLVAGNAQAAGAVGVLIQDGDRIIAEITQGDSDAFAVSLCEGDQLTFSAKADKDADLLPLFSVFRPDGGAVAVGEYLRKGGTTKPAIKKMPVGPGESGEWQVVVGSEVGGRGAYTVKVRIKRGKPAKVKGLEVQAGQIVGVPVTGFDGVLLGVSLKERSGPELAGIRLLDPTGAEVAGAASFTRKKSKLSAKDLPLAGGCGLFLLELTGDPSGATTVDVKFKKKLPKRKPRKDTLPTEATVSSVTPAHVKQGTSGAVVTIEGADLLSGTVAEVTGPGVALQSQELVDATSIRLTIDVAIDAPLGSHDVFLYPPPELGEPMSADLKIHAPTPTVTSFVGSPVRQGDEGVLIEIRGTNFREGGQIIVVGDGVGVGAPTLEGDMRAWATADVADDATAGTRAVGWQQPAIGGSEQAHLDDVLEIHYPVPSVESLSRLLLRPGETDVTVVLYGQGFREGMEVDCGEGVTVTSSRFSSPTAFELTVSVDQGPTVGYRDVSVTQRSEFGGAGGALSTAFAVDPGTKLIADDGTRDDDFGRDVAADGDTLVISAHSFDNARGAVYVFENGPQGWEQKQKLTADDGAAIDIFGICVDLEGDTLVVGAPGDDADAQHGEGAVYVFTRDQGTWKQDAKLRSTDLATRLQFGRSIDLDGDTLAVGADRAMQGSDEVGAVHVFTRDEGTWTEEAVLHTEDLEHQSGFGQSLALDGDTLFAGASATDGADLDVGAAYVFERDGGSWTQVAKLEPAVPVRTGYFGRSVALDGDVAVVGASGRNSAFVYERDETWSLRKELFHGTGTDSIQFGIAVAVLGDRVAVGDWAYDGPQDQAGSVHLFQKRDSIWEERDRVLANDTLPGLDYGFSVFLDAGGLFVGAMRYEGKEFRSGAAFVYRLP
jgi:hypothetical protein